MAVTGKVKSEELNGGDHSDSEEFGGNLDEDGHEASEVDSDSDTTTSSEVH